MDIGKSRNTIRAEELAGEIELLRQQLSAAEKQKEQQRQKEEEREKRRQKIVEVEKEVELLKLQMQVQRENQAKERLMKERKKREEEEEEEARKAAIERNRRNEELMATRKLLSDLFAMKQAQAMKKEIEELRQKKENEKKKNELRRQLRLYEKQQELLVMEEKMKEAKRVEELAQLEADACDKAAIAAANALAARMKVLEAQILALKERGEAMDLPLDITPVDWTKEWKIKSERAVFHSFKVTSFFSSSKPLDEVVIEECTPVTKTVQIREQPFDKGAFRFAFYTKTDTGERMVSKRLIVKMNDRKAEWKELTEMTQVQVLATHFTQEFNRKKPSSSNRMNYGSVAVIELIDRDPPVFMTAEPFLGGSFEKFNNNANYVKEGHPDAQALSHFSYIFSNRKFLLCDIQGVRDECCYNLTDPAFHTKCGKGYGDTNLGMEGITKFFSVHQCNSTCHALGLKKEK